jgi:predicted RNase H-like HicB family nuclease
MKAAASVARIPDLPAISGAGTTRAQALDQLIYYANAHVRSLLEHAEEVPPPRDIDDIPVEQGVEELGRALIPVEMPGKSVKIFDLDRRSAAEARRPGRQRPRHHALGLPREGGSQGPWRESVSARSPSGCSLPGEGSPCRQLKPGRTGWHCADT